MGIVDLFLIIVQSYSIPKGFHLSLLLWSKGVCLNCLKHKALTVDPYSLGFNVHWFKEFPPISYVALGYANYFFGSHARLWCEHGNWHLISWFISIQNTNWRDLNFDIGNREENIFKVPLGGNFHYFVMFQVKKSMYISWTIPSFPTFPFTTKKKHTKYMKIIFHYKDQESTTSYKMKSRKYYKKRQLWILVNCWPSQTVDQLWLKPHIGQDLLSSSTRFASSLSFSKIPP